MIRSLTVINRSWSHGKSWRAVSLVSDTDASAKRFGLTEFRKEWAAIRRGIEKESLRITPAGRLSRSSHPAGLGSALTNPYITTDFSEALLEFITPTTTSVEDCLTWLDAIHQFAYRQLSDDERLWVCSMPCPLSSDEEIPLAQYGSSNIGRLKNLYRMGLGHRYGRLMQTIAGIHYNFSMPDDFWPPFQKMKGDTQTLQEFRTASYLHLIRNFHRNSWLLFYLFGASPAACKCFVEGRPHQLQQLDPHSLYMPFATCLRMGDLGYRSDAQKSLFVCYNELDSYLDSLNTALHTPYPPYEQIGMKKNGEYLQINCNLLQLENEFYSSVRPKRAVKRGERPITALTRDGIEYVEIRALDLNPFHPLGIDREQIRFLDAFLLYCLLEESPVCDEKEYFQIGRNTQAVVENGRDPRLKLQRNGESVLLREWGETLLSGIAACGVLLDDAKGITEHAESLAIQYQKLEKPELTPSGKMLDLMSGQQQSFYDFGILQAQIHRDYFANAQREVQLQQELAAASSKSVEDQKRIELADKVDFDTFLANWNKF